ncbi:MAG: hypothetical protein V1749_03670 [Candidatus Desantisbacteria bacterium]
MKEGLQKRLEELKEEFQKGQQQLDTLDKQRAELRDTLLRISGAIQVLGEEVEKGEIEKEEDQIVT